jgi:3alpha(or 20beta)-hydroxysteroid dehydrogenase
MGNAVGMSRLQDKIAVITGAARGQGAAEARRFVEEGARVVVTDVLDQQGEALAAELGDAAVYRHLDVTDEDGWQTLVEDTVERWGRVDVLVNNAGILQFNRLTNTSLDDFEHLMSINCTGCFLGMRAVAEPMKRQQAGSIVNISSVAGLRGVGFQFAYSVSKWAVRGMTKSAAQELARHNIRVNSVHPGIIDTAMLDQFAEHGMRDGIEHHIPMGRSASAGEVAELVLWLASDDSSYSTGSEFVVDGGLMTG